MSNTLIKNRLTPDKWVDNYADYLFNYAIARVDDYDTVKDIIQETFMAGIKSAKNFEGKASEKTWLTSILKRKIIDYYRKINSKKGQTEIRINFYNDGKNEGNWLEDRVPQSWSDTSDKNIEKEELSEQLSKCINNLPEKYAIAFKMKTIQNFETEDICNELGISASNFWVIIHRARTQLRRCMEDNWFKK